MCVKFSFLLRRDEVAEIFSFFRFFEEQKVQRATFMKEVGEVKKSFLFLRL
jgi:hypothetical protein